MYSTLYKDRDIRFPNGNVTFIIYIYIYLGRYILLPPLAGLEAFPDTLQVGVLVVAVVSGVARLPEPPHGTWQVRGVGLSDYRSSEYFISLSIILFCQRRVEITESLRKIALHWCQQNLLLSFFNTTLFIYLDTVRATAPHCNGHVQDVNNNKQKAVTTDHGQMGGSIMLGAAAVVSVVCQLENEMKHQL